jgi:inosine/xanthosine triphosphate pyrophosphatase family protein
MTKEEKNSLSHRYKALDRLRSWLESLDAEQGD